MMQVTNRHKLQDYYYNNPLSTRSKPTSQQTNVITEDEQQEKIGFGKGFLAFVSGDLVGSIIKNTHVKKINPQFIKQINNLCNKSNPVEMSEAVSNAFEKSGLIKKGVELVDISKLPDFVTDNKNQSIFDVFNRTEGYKTQRILQIYGNELMANPLTKNLVNSKRYGRTFIETITKSIGPALEKGKNAVFFPYTNKILLNSEKIGLAAFHEMGHALNRNNSKFLTIIQKTRPLGFVLAMILPTFALLTNKKGKDNPPQTKWGKTKTFIKENVGKLTTLTFLPIIIEEIIASIKGQKLAKMVAPKEMLKNITKVHHLGILSYVGVAVVSGFGAFIGNLTRDKIASTK